MVKTNKKVALKKYLGEKRLETLDKLCDFVEKSDNEIDNVAYKNMLNTLLKYSIDETNYYYARFMVKEILKRYYDISYKIILKMSYYNTEELFKMYEFINSYTEKNIDFKILIINEFKKFGIIEERSLFEPTSYNLYKKLLQVLSVIYKKDHKKDSEELYKNSRLNNIQVKGKKLAKKIVELNHRSYLINEVPIVKPTITTMDIVCNLPDIIVDNEEDLKKIIDSLYKMFWENKIKDYSKNGELNFINNLRRYFFHDLEHDRKSKTIQKIKLVKNFYKSALGKSIPETAKDWQTIQEHIYDLLLDFLENIEIKELISD